jgi:chemotaxis protein CheX
MNTETTTPQLSREELVEIIRASTLEVFSTMLGTPVEAGETRTETDTAIAPKSGIMALVGVAGPWAGTGCIACSGTLACTLAAQFLMASVDTMNEDVLDALGEITNMIIGNVKTVLEEKLGPMGLSTPTVIFGRNFQTRSARVHDWTVVPFTCGEETFWVQMCIGPNKENRGTVRAGFQMPQVLNI